MDIIVTCDEKYCKNEVEKAICADHLEEKLTEEYNRGYKEGQENSGE